MAPKTKAYAYLEIVESHYTAGIGSISIGANYQLFSLLADVRNGGGVTAVSKPKGFPKDMAKGTQAYFDDVVANSKLDLHSQTWLDTDEVEKVVKGADTYAPGVVAALGAMKALKAKGSEPRLILTFEG